MIEIKANVTFGQYRAGKYYQVDENHSGVQHFIRQGYFQQEAPNELGSGSDSAGMGSVSDSGVEKRTPGRPKKKVTDGKGEDLPSEGDGVYSPQGPAAGDKDVSGDLPRG